MQNQLNISVQEIESMDTPDFNNWFIGVTQGVAIGVIAVSIT
ncbi:MULTISPECIES: daptide-type RiPP [unclassified Arthrobacter]|nr:MULTISPECIES: daptide-type RiPP [unclassified Arthrobacter]